MSPHPRISLHQVAFMRDGTPAFFDFCRRHELAHMTIVPMLMTGPDDLAAVKAAGGPKPSTLNHPFAIYPNLQQDEGQAAQKLLDSIALAAAIGAQGIYLQTGGRGGLGWEQAAAKFIDLLAPCKAAARSAGISLMIENASPFNADIHIAHTLADTILLAEMAEIAICIDLQPCWTEAGLIALFRRAMPRTGLVQVSDYILGDRTAPCRAVPGDGVIPLERLIGELLGAGYTALFDIELVGPRIEQEGAAAASLRAVEWLSACLTRRGA